MEPGCFLHCFLTKNYPLKENSQKGYFFEELSVAQPEVCFAEVTFAVWPEAWFAKVFSVA